MAKRNAVHLRFNTLIPSTRKGRQFSLNSNQVIKALHQNKMKSPKLKSNKNMMMRLLIQLPAVPLAVITPQLNQMNKALMMETKLKLKGRPAPQDDNQNEEAAESLAKDTQPLDKYFKEIVSI